MKKQAPLIIGLLIAAGALYYCLRNIDLGELLHSFTEVDYRFFPILIAMLTLPYYLRAVRWKYLIHPIKEVKTMDVMGPLLIGFLFNMLPARIGEFVRAFVLSKKENLPFTASFGTVFMERLFDLLFLGLSMVVCMLLFPEAFVPSGAGEDQDILLKIKGLGMTVFAGFLGILVFAYILVHRHDATIAVIRKLTGFLKESWQHTILNLIKHFSDGLSILKSPADTIKVTLLSAMLWICFPLSFYPLYFMYDLQLPFYTIFVLNIFVCSFITLFPTPAFIGSFQAGVVFCLSGIFGVSEVISNSLGMMIWIMGFLVVIIGGVFYLFKEDLSFTSLLEATKKTKEADEGEV